MNVLVTGGAGYIGSHCCKELHKRGYNPIVIDNLAYGHRENVKWGDFHEADIADHNQLERCFEERKIDAVMHFAAFAYVGESVTHPMKYYENNVKKTIELLSVLLKKNVKNFVFSSSCAVYGYPNSIPIDEKHSKNPINPYGRTKLIVEKILEDYYNAYGLHFISLRYFNAAGADPDCEIGEKHNPETHLIPLVLEAASGKLKSVDIFGTDYPTKDGTCIRDYIHVMDLAEAHVLSLEKLLNGGKSDFINLGIGKGYSVLEIIEKASEITGRNIPTVRASRRSGDPPVLVADNNKAIHELGWHARFTGIEEMIETAWTWHKKQLKEKPLEM